MYHSELSDSLLELLIGSARRDLLILTEIKEKREKEKRHSVSTFTPITKGKYKGCIGEVICNCGEVTRYRKPIKLISDFTCPKDKG